MHHAERSGGPVAATQKCASWSLVGCDEGQEMYGVELYAAVRLAVVDEGLSHHETGRRFGIDRRTVKKGDAFRQLGDMASAVSAYEEVVERFGTSEDPNLQ